MEDSKQQMGLDSGSGEQQALVQGWGPPIWPLGYSSPIQLGQWPLYQPVPYVIGVRPSEPQPQLGGLPRHQPLPMYYLQPVPVATASGMEPSVDARMLKNKIRMDSNYKWRKLQKRMEREEQNDWVPHASDLSTEELQKEYAEARAEYMAMKVNPKKLREEGLQKLEECFPPEFVQKQLLPECLKQLEAKRPEDPLKIHVTQEQVAQVTLSSLDEAERGRVDAVEIEGEKFVPLYLNRLIGGFLDRAWPKQPYRKVLLLQNDKGIYSTKWDKCQLHRDHTPNLQKRFEEEYGADEQPVFVIVPLEGPVPIQYLPLKDHDRGSFHEGRVRQIEVKVGEVLVVHWSLYHCTGVPFQFPTEGCLRLHISIGKTRGDHSPHHVALLHVVEEYRRIGKPCPQELLQKDKKRKKQEQKTKKQEARRKLHKKESKNINVAII